MILAEEDRKCDLAPRTGMVAALASGVVVHLFGLVNILHNYDDIAQQPAGYGTGVTIGRWLLTLSGDLMKRLRFGYNLPVVNGLLFLALLAVAVWLMVDLFQIRSRGQAALMGVLFAVFPTAFSTLLFRYTSVYYGVGIVLAVLAVWILGRVRFDWLISVACIACSMGIYQAYVPITITLFVLVLLRQCLVSQSEDIVKKTVVQGFRDCGILILGLALYFVLLKATLSLYNTQLTGYQGVDQMGQISAGELPGLIKKAYYQFLMLPLRSFWGVTDTPLLKIALALLGLLSLGMLWVLLRGKRPGVWLLAGGLCLCLPLAVNFVIVMCPQSDIYTIMVYAVALVPCVPIVLLSCFPSQPNRMRRAVAALLAVMCFSYGYQTNVNYAAVYYSNRQVENYMSGLVTQVRMTEGFTPEKKWAFLGVIDDPLLYCYWQFEPDYGGAEFTAPLLRRYSWQWWMWNYCGYMPTMASDEEVSALFETQEVKDMPCWPAEGSIRAIGDTMVVKFSQTNIKPL